MAAGFNLPSLTSLTGGGALTPAGGGPSSAYGQASIGFDNAFSVNFAGRNAWVPWLAVAAVALVLLWRRR